MPAEEKQGNMNMDFFSYEILEFSRSHWLSLRQHSALTIQSTERLFLLFWMLLSTDFRDGTEKYYASMNKLNQHFKDISISEINNCVYSKNNLSPFKK